MGLPGNAIFTPPEIWFDRVGVFVVAGFFQLKFFLLFSFIFGWGVHIQMRSALLHGYSFKRRYFRRMAGLAVLGVAHAIFVFSGDILLLYSLLGGIFWLVKAWPVKSLLSIGKWMLPLSVSFILLMIVSFALAGFDELEGASVISHAAGGHFMEATRARLIEWPISFSFVFFLQGPLAFSAFAVGLAAAKSDFFSEQSNGLERIRKKLPLLLILGLPINAFYASFAAGLVSESYYLLELIGFVFVPIGAIALATIYLYCFVRLSRGWKIPNLLTLAGQNSLSTYVAQGVIAGFVFGAYGLGYFNTFGQAALLPIAVIVAALSILLVGCYARMFGRGPLEPILRWISR